MQFQVTEIEYDFTQDDDDWSVLPDEHFEDVINETLQKVWEVESEDELVDTISDCFGWCIKSLKYNTL